MFKESAASKNNIQGVGSFHFCKNFHVSMEVLAMLCGDWNARETT